MDAATHNQHKNIKQKKAHLGPKKINEKEVVTDAPRKLLHLDVHAALALRPSTHAAPQRWGGLRRNRKGPKNDGRLGGFTARMYQPGCGNGQTR